MAAGTVKCQFENLSQELGLNLPETRRHTADLVFLHKLINRRINYPDILRQIPIKTLFSTRPKDLFMRQQHLTDYTTTAVLLVKRCWATTTFLIRLTSLRTVLRLSGGKLCCVWSRWECFFISVVLIVWPFWPELFWCFSCCNHCICCSHSSFIDFMLLSYSCWAILSHSLHKLLFSIVVHCYILSFII